jgi:hypothetical protein
MRRRDSSVGVAIRQRDVRTEDRIAAGVRHVSLVQNAQRDFKIHTACYSVATRVLSR